MASAAPDIPVPARESPRRRLVYATIAAGVLAFFWLGVTAWERVQDQRTREQMEAVAASFERDGFRDIRVRRDKSIGPFHARRFMVSMEGDVTRISAETAEIAASNERLLAFVVREDEARVVPDFRLPRGFVMSADAGRCFFHRRD